MISPSIKQELFSRLGRDLKEDVPLAPLTTIKIGGTAALFYPAHSASELVTAVEHARELDLPFWLLGGGSNLVISDDGLDGLVIVDSNREHFEFLSDTVTVSSGIALAEIVEQCSQRLLAGFEFAVGIPGNIGGAVCGNAGAYGVTLGELLLEAEIWTPEGRIETVPASFFGFQYRESVFKKTEGLVLSATFRVKPGLREKIDELMQANYSQRMRKLPPPDLPSAGSFFKNLPPETPGERRRAAGYYLEQAGCKGLRCGGAQVFEKHANIIVNTGGATARDVRSLANTMKEHVEEQFGLTLEEEARYLGNIETEKLAPRNTSAQDVRG